MVFFNMAIIIYQGQLSDFSNYLKSVGNSSGVNVYITEKEAETENFPSKLKPS